MTSPHELVELYARLGREILAQTTTDGALGAVTMVAVDAIPGTAYASITRRRSTGFQTLGATHPDATAHDQEQYRLVSGPCIDAARDDAEMVLVPDVGHDPRYPVFGPRVAAGGVGSMLSTQLVFDEHVGVDVELRASLNLYAVTPHAFDQNAQTTALVMATHGALAVAGVVARENAANLKRALLTSRTIGTAIGIVMSSLLLTKDDAFALLRIASQNYNRKLADIAEDVVATGTLDIQDLPGRQGPPS